MAYIQHVTLSGTIPAGTQGIEFSDTWDVNTIRQWVVWDGMTIPIVCDMSWEDDNGDGGYGDGGYVYPQPEGLHTIVANLYSTVDEGNANDTTFLATTTYDFTVASSGSFTVSLNKNNDMWFDNLPLDWPYNNTITLNVQADQGFLDTISFVGGDSNFNLTPVRDFIPFSLQSSANLTFTQTGSLSVGPHTIPITVSSPSITQHPSLSMNSFDGFQFKKYNMHQDPIGSWYYSSQTGHIETLSVAAVTSIDLAVLSCPSEWDVTVATPLVPSDRQGFETYSTVVPWTFKTSDFYTIAIQGTAAGYEVQTQDQLRWYKTSCRNVISGVSPNLGDVQFTRDGWFVNPFDNILIASYFSFYANASDVINISFTSTVVYGGGRTLVFLDTNPTVNLTPGAGKTASFTAPATGRYLCGVGPSYDSAYGIASFQLSGSSNTTVQLEVQPSYQTFPLSGAPATLQYSVECASAGSTEVVWSVAAYDASDPGSIDSSGLYTVPTSDTAVGIKIITATSVADPTKSCKATFILDE